MFEEIKVANSHFEENFQESAGSEPNNLANILLSNIKTPEKEANYNQLKYELVALKEIKTLKLKNLSNSSKNLIEIYNEKYNPYEIMKELSQLTGNKDWKWSI